MDINTLPDDYLVYLQSILDGTETVFSPEDEQVAIDLEDQLSAKEA